MNTTWAMNALRLQKDNTKLAGLLEEALDCIDQYDYEEAFDLVQRIKDALNHSRMSHPPVVPWGGSSLTEMEELLQKTQQLQRENAALREQIATLGEIAVLNYDDATVGKCDAITGGGEKYKDVMHRLFVDQPKENAALRADVLDQCTLNAKGGEREYVLLGKVEQLRRELATEREKAERYRLVTLRQDADNTALCNKLAALENQTQWECSCGGTDCEGQKENDALRDDKKILDWMEKNVWAINFKYKPDNFILDVREIMRGAMNKEAKPDA